MYFRCPECLAATWHDDERPVRDFQELSCAGCSKVLVARPVSALGSSTAEHFRAMLGLANELGVDAASSYSLLLGILSFKELPLVSSALDRAPFVHVPAASVEMPARAEEPELVTAGVSLVSISQPGAATAPATALSRMPIRPTARTEVPGYDPGFGCAVASGRLTVREAVLRGEREVFVASLVARHSLSRDLACRVADNRVSLRQALAVRPVHPPPPKPAPSRSRQRFASALMFLVAFGALGVVTLCATTRWEQSFPPPPRAQSRRVGVADAAAPRANEAGSPSAPHTLASKRQAVTLVQRDAGGQIVEIVGPDPAAVLVAFCQASEDGGGWLEPLEITDTVPRLVHAKLGLFRDPAAFDVRQAIWMRRDHRTQRWVAGDGKNAIPVRPAPELPPAAHHEFVR